MRTPIILTVVAVALLILMNPDMGDFRVFVEEQSDHIVRRETGEGVLGELAGALAGQLSGRYVDRVTQRESYLVFSTYTVEFDGDPDDGDAWRFLGIGGQFIELERPEGLVPPGGE